MNRIYFDNAATTILDKEVLDTMVDSMNSIYGNPSSTHTEGRKARALVESARKTIAKCINASINEIFFTSGGTESNNTALKCAVRDLNIKRIISTKIEHHCVGHSLSQIQRRSGVEVILLDNDQEGHISLNQLEQYLQASPLKTLVSIMHANNEIGTVSDMYAIGELCKKYGAIFHSDTVQTIGHFPIDVTKVHIHFLSGAAHKIHGPKGVGFLYINSDNLIEPFIDGGSQEKNMRGGTENLHGIVGMAKSFELAVKYMSERTAYITGLKNYFIENIVKAIPECGFNGDISSESLFTVLNVDFPDHPKNEMLLFNLDIQGIAVSGGSACTSGAEQGSHVIAALNKEPSRKAVRFSFSHHNTQEEIDFTIEKLASIYSE
ncbi:MAG TPA: cysteine desulfurase family protein [Saprospiraceae bacterium]|nr:cysteine desulfurase family protein [Saprospiraceae bacterium]